MGAADPTGLLKDNEIFLQIKEDEDSPSRIISGRVLIYRNPCLHPGDLRWVTAVDHPALRQWMNIVLLPTKNTNISLAAACSGGDLDGDHFAVIWDPRFIIPDQNPYSPLNYSELAKGAPEDFRPEMEASLFASLYVKIMKNDTLGMEILIALKFPYRHRSEVKYMPNEKCRLFNRGILMFISSNLVLQKFHYILCLEILTCNLGLNQL